MFQKVGALTFTDLLPPPRYDNAKRRLSIRLPAATNAGNSRSRSRPLYGRCAYTLHSPQLLLDRIWSFATSVLVSNFRSAFWIKFCRLYLHQKMSIMIIMQLIIINYILPPSVTNSAWADRTSLETEHCRCAKLVQKQRGERWRGGMEEGKKATSEVHLGNIFISSG